MYVWEMALTLVIFVPLMMLSAKVRHQLHNGYSELNKIGVEEGGKVNIIHIFVLMLHNYSATLYAYMLHNCSATFNCMLQS